MSRTVKVTVLDGGKSYTVLFPSPHGYVEELEVEHVEKANPVSQGIEAGKKEITISLAEAKTMKWSELIPEYSREAVYVVDADRVVGIYFLGCYCDASNTNMAVIQEGFDKNRFVAAAAGHSRHSVGCLRSDFS